MEIYTKWEILLAWLPSSDGTPPDRPHPCIYLGESPKHAGRIIVVGITSDLSTRQPGYSCDMPWADGKHAKTGLDRPSLAQAEWVQHIPLDAVRKVIGSTPLAEQHSVTECLNRRIVRDSK